MSLIDAVTMAAVAQRYPTELEKNVQLSRNFGRRGGWLRVEFLTSQGVATGHSSSRVEYPTERPVV